MGWHVRETFPEEEGLESDPEVGTWKAFQAGRVGSKFTAMKMRNGVLGSQQVIEPGGSSLYLKEVIQEKEGAHLVEDHRCENASQLG